MAVWQTGRQVPVTVAGVTARPTTTDALVEMLRSDPADTALLLDFDGTLAPIVDDPAAARAVDGVVEVLDALADRYATVAVVSGRPCEFLAAHLGPGVDLSGLYGVETRIGGDRREHPDADRWRDVIERVVQADDLPPAPPSADLEPKGVSLTVHFRRTPTAGPAILDWADRVAAATGLESRPAKASVELHPPIPTDKGTSVLDLAGDRGTVAYCGDDVGDLPAFAALDRLAAAGRATAKVAVASTDVPDAVRDAADLVLPDPEALRDVLRRLL